MFSFLNKGYKLYIYAAVIILVTSTFIILINKIYTLTLEEAKENHQKQQLEMAKAVSHGIEYYLDNLINEMNFISGSQAILPKGQSKFNEFVDNYYNNYDSGIIYTTMLIDTNNRIEYISGKKPSKQFLSETEELCKSISAKDNKNYFITKVLPEIYNAKDTVSMFTIMFPIKDNKGLEAKSKPEFIAFIVNFDLLISKFVKSLSLTKNDFIWILDNEGRLIYHPKHFEMLFNSIYTSNKECTSCHLTFDVQKKIVQSNSPFLGEYRVLGDEPNKIFATVPMHLGNQKWFITVSTFLPDVTKDLAGKFKLFFILGIFILSTIVFLIIVIYMLNFKRIRAEEAKKNLETNQVLQEQLNQTTKLASIGELVDAVAHEINTPVGIISAHIDFLLLQKEPPTDINSELSLIKRQTKRIAEYTRSLLNFSKKITNNPEKVDLKAIILECVFLLNYRLKRKSIIVITDFKHDSCFVLADKNQIEQVIMNLLNNAIDAIETEGEISISEDEVIVKSPSLINKDLLTCVKLEISDNGCGIKKDEVDKIFNPFFSTKMSNGTGLGLSITKSILQKYDATIKVESEPGVKTKFTILIPKNIN